MPRPSKKSALARAQRSAESKTFIKTILESGDDGSEWEETEITDDEEDETTDEEEADEYKDAINNMRSMYSAVCRTNLKEVQPRSVGHRVRELCQKWQLCDSKTY